MRPQKKVMTIIGTRPEAIKMAPFISLANQNEQINHVLLSTGQHKELLDQVLSFFNLKPDYDLKTMKRVKTVLQSLGRMTSEIEEILAIEKPDIIVVHGDTISTSAGALAAFYTGTQIFHIEAGLRTGSLAEPWPEEGNRKIVSAIADYHFCPTELSKQNLLNEGIKNHTIQQVGNTVIDALKLTQSITLANQQRTESLATSYQKYKDGQFRILMTCHRRENHGKNLNEILSAVKEIAIDQNVQFIIPVHPNPNVKKIVNETLAGYSNITLTESLEYDQFVYIMSISNLILSDSGGIQEEAPSLGKPVLVLRDKTERPEAIASGTARLVGTEKSSIVDAVNLLRNDQDKYNLMSKANNPFGDGTASMKIINFIQSL